MKLNKGDLMHITKLKMMIFTVLLVFAGSVTAGTISGFIKDATNEETLIAANVYIKDTQLGAMTNNQGYYIINNIPAGEVSLVCTYMGYERRELSLNLKINERRVVNLGLTPKALQSEAVVVEAEREEDIELVETGTIHVSPRTLKTAPVMAEADLMRTIQMMPGVLTSSEFSSGIYVRGGTPDQNLVLLDGSEVYNANHLFGLFSTFDVDAIKDVKFVRSGFSAKYGGRLSSVLDVTNKDGNQKSFEGKTSLGLVSAKTSLQGPLANGAWFFSGRRTYVDYMLNATEQGVSGEAKQQLEMIPDYYFYDMHLKIYQDFSHQDKLVLTFYQGSDNMNFSLDPFAFNINWGNRAVNARWTHVFSDKLFSNFYLSRSAYGSALDRDDALMTGQIFNDIEDFTMQGDLEYFPGNDHGVKLGFEYKMLESKYDARFEQQRMVLSSGSSSFAMYLQDEWKATPRLNIQPGVRVTNYSPTGFENTMEDSSYIGDPNWKISPRLAVQFMLTDKVRLKTAYGQYYQFVNIVPMGNDAMSFMDVWFPSDNSIAPASATHYVAGVEMDLPGDLTGTIEGYYKDMPQLYQFNTQATRVYKGEDLFHSGRGWAYGADFNLEKKTGDFTGWVSYSLGWTKRTFDAVNDGKTYYPRFDRRHSIKTVGAYRINERWSANFAWTYGTGQGYTRPMGHYQLQFPEDETSFVIGGERNNARMPHYHRLDMGVRYTKQLPESVMLESWSWYLQIFNAYNRRNLWHKNVNFMADGTAEVSEVRMLPILPTAGIEFSF
ncbi:MAG: TonB-dependent receptor [Candidatus Marinimicrobia bacterium]|nr:TonB-dependent receptor [Candidatus Neomarinimicrobiota bacterium]MCF7829721.1 TonB-dependent receptor [Candidatus Neomarinimicrobiota bacterium]MCF7881671.1 TonB-dependent receptor [Candidatus Neomarinimicrobiota bacterium]